MQNIYAISQYFLIIYLSQLIFRIQKIIAIIFSSESNGADDLEEAIFHEKPITCVPKRSLTSGSYTSLFTRQER